MEYKKSTAKNKKILIIPAAGKSTRFSTEKPKWMLTHPNGNLMIQEVVSGINLDFFDECHIVILKEHCEKYDADVIISQCLGNKFKVTILNTATTSSPETVAKCIKKNNINGFIVIKDCDCYVNFSCHDDDDNFIVGADVNKIFIKNLSSKSFIQTDVNNFVCNVVEKKIISDKVCLGVYAMKSSELLESLSRIKKISKTEIFFSNIVSFLISSGKKFNYLEAQKYSDWNTSEDWFSYRDKYKTYIVDIDGVCLRNYGKYGNKNWTNTFEPIEENIQILKKMSDEGHELIFITARDKNNIKIFSDFLKKLNIKYKTIIHSCYHAKRILVNDFADSNPYPSCEAINIPRNSNLNQFIK